MGHARFRLVDCVGYLIERRTRANRGGHAAHGLDTMERHPHSHAQAAELGTRKVIADHSTIGLVVTTDGTVTDFPREAYLDAEDRVIRELKSLHKPFLVLVNSMQPQGAEAQHICQQISDSYDVTAIAADCMNIDAEEMGAVLKAVLYEFPVREVGIVLPPWVNTLPAGHRVKESVYDGIRTQAQRIGPHAGHESVCTGTRADRLCVRCAGCLDGAGYRQRPAGNAHPAGNFLSNRR